ncbi:MAG: hypothetical protein KY462_06755 [Actinobacteria bacterium]|nr:hypothetical protein [Actinomycetota bacterium]
MSRFVLVLAVIMLAVTACQRAPEEEPVSPTSPAETVTTPASPVATGPMARTASCENADAAYRIDYPADWETNTGDVLAECSLFDPEPIDIEPGTQIGFDVAIAIRAENVSFERVAEEDMAVDETSREETTVAGRQAVRVEGEGTGQALVPDGMRVYRYAVDLDGATLIAVTYDAGELDFETKRQVLDEMVASLQFVGTPAPRATP